MPKIKKIGKAGLKYLGNTDYRFCINAGMGRYNDMPDEEYLKRLFRARIGNPLNLDNPLTYNEKLQWLKLYYRCPEYTVMVDKYLARDYVKKIIGEQYIIPLLGVWDDPDKIDFDKLPNQFVLKCNHNSGLGMCMCKDKSKLDLRNVRKNLKKALAQNYYLTSREWPYKNVPRKIIAEPYMVCKDGKAMVEYKIFCFNGKAKIILVCKGQAHGPGRTNDYCDLNLNRLPFTSLNPNSQGKLKRPEQMDKMIELAEKLAEGIPQVRVDLYLCDDNIYFGELTFFHNSGLDVIEPYEWDIKLGSWIELPERRN